jgi:HEAT repeat protein
MSWRRSRARWIAIVCAVLAACVGAAGVPDTVRYYRERRALRALGSGVVAERIAALEQLGSIGSSSALRGILSSLQMPPPPPEEWVFIQEPSYERYVFELGSDSMSWEWDLRCASAIYQGLGKNALPRLRSALGSSEPNERYWALRFLWRIPELAADGASPALLELLDDDDPRVRSEVVMAIAMSAETKPFLVDHLIQGLRSAHAAARSRAGAAMALSLAIRQEPERYDTPSAVAALLEAALDDAITVRAECGRGLCVIRNRISDRVAARDIQRFLATRLSETDPDLRSLIAAHLQEHEAIPALIHVLDEGPPDARAGAVEVLRSIGGDAVWRAASDLLEKSDDSISAMTEDLLSSLDHAKIDHLVQALFSMNLGVRRAAVKVLRRQDRFDGGGLVPLLEDDDPEVRSQAAKALSWSVRIDADTLEQTVLELLAEARTDLLKKTACEVAPSLGPASVKAVPLLASLIEAEPWDGRPLAAAALGEIGPAARSALPSLAAAVVGRDPDLAIEAIGALAKVSPDGCAEMMARGLRHPSDRVQDAALGALWGLGSAAAPALPALRELAGNARAAELVSLLESR